jgi:hypothetical protein
MDFRLGAGSPAIDGGMLTGDASGGNVQVDFDGNLRPFDGDGLGAGSTGDGSDYDIGAFEFVGGEGEGEGEGEDPPVGCSGCEGAGKAGGPFDKSFSDWLVLFLGLTGLLAGQSLLRTRTRTSV